MPADPEAGRLLWRCRRGMKELDLLLVRYMQIEWPRAGAADREAFRQILDLPDPELAAYLVGNAEAPEPLRALLETLRPLAAPGSEKLCRAGNAPPTHGH